MNLTVTFQPGSVVINVYMEPQIPIEVMQNLQAAIDDLDAWPKTSPGPDLPPQPSIP